MNNNESLTKREYIPSYGPDKKALNAGMMWLLESNENQELFLYLSLKSHLNQGKLIYTMYGEEFCKTLQKNEKNNLHGKIINLLTNRSYAYVPKNSRILAVHMNSKALESIEKKYDFENLLVVAWNCFPDLPDWINKHGATQYERFLPINPIKYPGWSSRETLPPNNFIFSEVEFEEYKD